MVIERIKDTLGGDDGPNMVTTTSKCPKCGNNDVYTCEYEKRDDGKLVLDNIYCERGCQI